MSDTEVLEPDTRPRSEIHVGEPAGEPLMDAATWSPAICPA